MSHFFRHSYDNTAVNLPGGLYSSKIQKIRNMHQVHIHTDFLLLVIVPIALIS